MSKFLVKYRYLVLGVTLALAAVCGVLMFHVNVNTDLTKYLPDDSPMKAGLDLLTTEFDLSADMAGGDVRVMADSLSATEKVDLKYQLHQLLEVSNVTIQENGTHTLYELSVDKSIDQVALGKEIHASHPKIAAVETAQDGTTAEPTMLLGAMALLLIVFFAMCASWIEPVLFLASTGIAVIVTGLPSESDETYAFLDKYKQLCDKSLSHGYYSVGESVMLAEMKAGFQREMTLVTLLTIAAIFLIVFFTFRSLLVALILVATVMTGVFVDVSVSAIGGGSLLYLAYLIVQSILMGAAIDYGILFANYYREKRTTLDIGASLREAYRGTVNTILTSGLILILVPGAMAVLVEDPTISSIVSAISIGAMATVTLVLLVLPGMLAAIEGKIKN